MTYDFIIVGSGHNGLTCAGYLAKAGATPQISAAAFDADAPGGERKPAGRPRRWLERLWRRVLVRFARAGR
ncbi:MAG: hypothetical protein IT508_01890 [Burkholderiaceae bacterium]|nr:hypothetical protein [Burkholderiaceae bacterium]